jgi:hypothetical protein
MICVEDIAVVALRPRKPFAPYAYLPDSRAAFVRQYWANPHPWPHGPGAWYRAEDWDDAGKLLATGEARARALDPWANDRAKGEPCPPLRGVGVPAACKLEAYRQRKKGGAS